MSKPKITRWFPVRVNPARKGYYEARYSAPMPTDICMRYWDGKNWYVSPFRENPCLFGITSQDKWRGLASDPAKKGKA